LFNEAVFTGDFRNGASQVLPRLLELDTSSPAHRSYRNTSFKDLFVYGSPIYYQVPEVLFYIQVFRLIFNIIASMRTTCITHSIILDCITVNITSTACTLWRYQLFRFSSTSAFVAQYQVAQRSHPYKPVGNGVICTLWFHVRHICKISKRGISFVMSVCPHRTTRLPLHGFFLKFYIWGFFENLRSKFNFH